MTDFKNLKPDLVGQKFEQKIISIYRNNKSSKTNI